MEILIKASQLILSLSILVILHELGHFIPAKLFKTKVEKFYLFFDPWFSLFKVKKGDTEYGIGWLPLGGYVKISGMIDESMDKEQMKEAPKSWEFRAKPTWQRLIIMVGGVTVNVILGILIYSMVLFAWGEKFIPNDSLTDGVWCTDSLAYDMGFRNGDKILTINEHKIERFRDIMPELIYSGVVEVEREGKIETIHVPPNFIERLIDAESKMLFYPRVPFIIAGFTEDSPAEKAGLLAKDEVVGLNGKRIKYFDQFKEEIREHKGKEVTLTVKRENSENDVVVAVSEEGLIGTQSGIYSFKEMEKAGLYNFSQLEYGLIESFPAGLNMATDKLMFYVKQFKMILDPSTGAYKGVGGFGAIGGLFPPEWEWKTFWEITAFLSLILAFMNILPIPALDGGHVMFLLYEMVARRKPNEKFMEYAQIAGMVLLLSLLVFANGNDLFRLLK